MANVYEQDPLQPYVSTPTNTPQLEQSSQQGCRLFCIPDELLLVIIDQISEHKTLQNLAVTCQKAQYLAEPRLYRDITIRNGRQVRSLLWIALRNLPHRGHYVQHLDVRHKAAGRLGISLLNKSKGFFPNLRSWRIESPCPNDNIEFTSAKEAGEDIGELYYWRDVLNLKHLETLRIHTHSLDPSNVIRSDNDNKRKFFDLAGGAGAVIFTHPTLKHLHLSCADVNTHTIGTLKHHAVSTPLVDLVFEECNISAEALQIILSLPKALKLLTLGERIHHVQATPGRFLTESRNSLAKALALQASSLQYLKQTQQMSQIMIYWNGLNSFERRRFFTLPQDLPDMPALTEIDLHYGSPLQGLAARLSSKLEKIRVHNFYKIDDPRDHLCALERELRLFDQPSLKHLEIVFPEVRTDRADTEAIWLKKIFHRKNRTYIFRDPGNRLEFYKLGIRLRKIGVRLTVNWVRTAGYIPPYMHGEILPTEFTIYDSDHPQIFGHVPSGHATKDWYCDKLETGEGPDMSQLELTMLLQHVEPATAAAWPFE